MIAWRLGVHRFSKACAAMLSMRAADVATLGAVVGCSRERKAPAFLDFGDRRPSATASASSDRERTARKIPGLGTENGALALFVAA